MSKNISSPKDMTGWLSEEEKLRMEAHSEKQEEVKTISEEEEVKLKAEIESHYKGLYNSLSKLYTHKREKRFNDVLASLDSCEDLIKK